MMRRRKIVIGTVACAFAVSILLLAAILIAPKVVDSETVKAKVRSELLKVAAVEIDFDHLILNFFPRPHVIIDRVDLAIPPGVKGKAASVTVQPKILLLFLGKMKIAGLYLDSAELDYPLKSAAWGELKGKNIIFPWRPDTPRKINDFAITANTHKINLQLAKAAIGGNRWQAVGYISRSARNVFGGQNLQSRRNLRFEGPVSGARKSGRSA